MTARRRPPRHRPVLAQRPMPASNPDRPAVITSSGQTVTFAELEGPLVPAGPGALRPRPAAGRSRGGLCCPTTTAPTRWCGACSVPASTTRWSTPTWRADEAAYIVNDCGAKVLITSSALAPLAEALVARDTRASTCAWLSATPTPDGHRSYDEVVGRHPSHAAGRRAGGVGHAVLLGHHRPAQGDPPSPLGRPLRLRAPCWRPCWAASWDSARATSTSARPRCTTRPRWCGR